MPDGRAVTQWADANQWRQERLQAFPQAERFWQTQEMLADISWDISTRPFPWPPESVRDLFTLASSLRPKTLKSLPYLLRTIGSIAPQGDPMFDAFLNAQLLIYYYLLYFLAQLVPRYCSKALSSKINGGCICIFLTTLNSLVLYFSVFFFHYSSCIS